MARVHSRAFFYDSMKKNILFVFCIVNNFYICQIINHLINYTMTTTNKYNGWTNYATWRVHLEIFDGQTFDEPIDIDFIKDFAEEIVFMDSEENTLAYDYARSFLSEVNWYEIQQALIDNE